MKTLLAFAVLGAAFVLTGCETTVVERGPAVHRRYISYNDNDPYYRVYYRDSGRTYYRQHYYDDYPRHSTRVVDRRYYYNAPADRGSVTFGF